MLKQVIRQRETEKRKKLALAAAFFVLVIAFTVFFLSQVPPVQRRYIYPYPHQELVELYARANGVDSALVASVIMTESRFRKDALSHRGAVGLMQIMPETGAWIAQQLEDTDYTPEKLWEPETNIRYGVWYLAELLREFAGNDFLALAAYNAGRGQVREWMEEGRWPLTFHSLNSIPYPETRDYVKNVLRDRTKYEALYPPK
ncbi:MAG: lytic transglycosylase domain-containing protein [Schwartzia sp.]|nr:lytic transglycosylase domain-containing protein [Schwartzia sp. (in: firmicutes)]